MKGDLNVPQLGDEIENDIFREVAKCTNRCDKTRFNF